MVIRDALIGTFMFLATALWVCFEGFLSVRRRDSLPSLGIIRGTGASMEPLITSPGFVIYRPKIQYTVGDVVVFRSDGTYVVHRIVEKVPAGYLTKGDGNHTDDSTDHGVLRETEIVGVARFAVSPSGVGDPTVRL